MDLVGSFTRQVGMTAGLANHIYADPFDVQQVVSRSMANSRNTVMTLTTMQP
jgi:hypothetical protein